MAFFAVVSDSETTSDFDVVHCHLNLWVLPGLFGYHALYFDLGLRLRVCNHSELQSLHVALPFETKDRDIESLHESLQQESVAELIFGTAVETSKSSDERTITYAGLKTATLLDVQGVVDKDRSGPDYTSVTLKLNRALDSGRDGYLRVRFRVSRSRRLWKCCLGSSQRTQRGRRRHRGRVSCHEIGREVTRSQHHNVWEPE